MPNKPISDADWRWLRDEYGDFVLEEPGYAPKLLALRDKCSGTNKSTGALSSISVPFRTEPQVSGGIIIRQFSPRKG